MKRWTALGILLLLLLLPGLALAQDTRPTPQIEVPDALQENMQEADPDFDFQQAIEDMQNGQTSFGAAWLFEKAGGAFLKQLRGSLKTVAAVLVVGVLFAVVGTLDLGTKGGISTAAGYVCLLVLFGLIVAAFYTAQASARTVVESVCTFLRSMLMVLFSYLATAGSFVSAGVYSSTFLVVTQILSDVVLNVLFPLSVMALVFSFINALYERPVLSSAIGLLKSASKYLLSFMFIVFLGMAGLQGALSSTFEGMAAKSAKFAVKSVPVVGGLLSDSADVVLSSSVLIKNSIGTAGILALIVAVLVPVLQLLVTGLIFKGGGALLEVVAGEKFAKCLGHCGDAVFMLLGCVLCVFVFAVAALGVVIATGNAAMLR